MNRDEFTDFQREAIHELMRLNEICKEKFRISSWPRWDYEFEGGTLTFSQDGVPKVIAAIQVVGSTSISGGTWLWSWANASLPAKVTAAMGSVRAFGEAENLVELTRASSPDNEYLGWEMTAIAAKVLGSKGAYRCPGNNGFVYVVYTSIQFANEYPDSNREPKLIDCTTHGAGFQAFVCQHLISNPVQEWHSKERDKKNKWPDAWCGACDVFFQQEGEWNDKNESNLKIKILCHQCYELLRYKARPQ